jgi:RNA polymerase sigma-70 factor (ECF subfamily)
MDRATLDFERIHRDLRPRVLRYVARLVGEQDAPDVTQAVMLKVSAALPRFRGASSVATWVYRIARNAALDALRRKAVEPILQPAPQDPEEDAAPSARAHSAEATAARAEANACIREFIARLPARDRAAIELSELEGFSNEEIAGRLGVSAGAVKIRLHRARARLREQLRTGCTFAREGDDDFACDRRPPASDGSPRGR